MKPDVPLKERAATMILPRNNLRTSLGRKSCDVGSEKPDKKRVGIKVVCAGLQIVSMALCSVGLVNPHVIQMQLNQ
jgi:hypothetical protein